MSHCRRREYQAFFCKILCRLVTPRHASAHANHHNISLDLLAAASRGTGASRRGQAARRSVRRVQMSLKAATSASRCVLGYRRSDVSSQRMAASGQSSPFDGRRSGDLREADTAREILKPTIGPQGIECRTHQDGGIESRLIGLVQPDHRLVVIAEPEIDQRDTGVG